MSLSEMSMIAKAALRDPAERRGEERRRKSFSTLDFHMFLGYSPSTSVSHL